MVAIIILQKYSQVFTSFLISLLAIIEINEYVNIDV